MKILKLNIEDLCVKSIERRYYDVCFRLPTFDSVYSLLVIISRLACNLLFENLLKVLNFKSLLRHWCMHTIYFDQYWSSSGVSKISDETAVLPSVSSIFGVSVLVETRSAHS
jgi:hypothetical protein